MAEVIITFKCNSCNNVWFITNSFLKQYVQFRSLYFVITFINQFHWNKTLISWRKDTFIKVRLTRYLDVVCRVEISYIGCFYVCKVCIVVKSSVVLLYHSYDVFISNFYRLYRLYKKLIFLYYNRENLNLFLTTSNISIYSALGDTLD